MHKIGGYASHSHTNFCIMCWITLKDKTTPDVFHDQGMSYCLLSFNASEFLPAFHPRMDEEQWHLGEEYRQLKTPQARINFMKQYATRFTQLSCLPYFNLVKQIVIDPMHNLFLGMYLIVFACAFTSTLLQDLSRHISTTYGFRPRSFVPITN